MSSQSEFITTLWNPFVIQSHLKLPNSFWHISYGPVQGFCCSEHSSISVQLESADDLSKPLVTQSHLKLPISFWHISYGPVHGFDCCEHSSMSVQSEASVILSSPEDSHSHWKVPYSFLHLSFGPGHTSSSRRHSFTSLQAIEPLRMFSNPSWQIQSKPWLIMFLHSPLGQGLYVHSSTSETKRRGVAACLRSMRASVVKGKRHPRIV